MNAATEKLLNVRVSAHKRKFAYVDYTKHRLHEGEQEIVISGLGSAITDAISVVELLKSQGLVVVKKIMTSRGNVDGAHVSNADKIEIIVGKSPSFDTIYDEQQKAREAARTAKEEKQAEQQ